MYEVSCVNALIQGSPADGTTLIIYQYDNLVDRF